MKNPALDVLRSSLVILGRAASRLRKERRPDLPSLAPYANLHGTASAGGHFDWTARIGVGAECVEAIWQTPEAAAARLVSKLLAEVASLDGLAPDAGAFLLLDAATKTPLEKSREEGALAEFLDAVALVMEAIKLSAALRCKPPRSKEPQRKLPENFLALVAFYAQGWGFPRNQEERLVQLVQVAFEMGG